MLTYDRVDFTKLNLEWGLQQRPHGGIIISVAPPKIPHREVMVRLFRFLDAVSVDEVVNNLFWLNDVWATP